MRPAVLDSETFNGPDHPKFAWHFDTNVQVADTISQPRAYDIMDCNYPLEMTLRHTTSETKDMRTLLIRPRPASRRWEERR